MATTPMYFHSFHFVGLSTPVFVNSTRKSSAYQTKRGDRHRRIPKQSPVFWNYYIKISMGIISNRIEVVSQNYRIVRFRRDL